MSADTFMGLLALILGIGAIALGLHGLSRGSFPPHFDRKERPIRFWRAFITYIVVGCGGVVFALRHLSGP